MSKNKEYNCDYLITGGTGMVGNAFKKFLPENESNVYIGSNVDLRSREETLDFFSEKTPRYVVHLAAKVGGVKGNSEKMGEFYADNIKINTNVLDAAKLYNSQKVVSLLSTCVYPADGPFPLVEENLHVGLPHDSNFGYAYAKRMIDVQSRAYRQQYGCNFICAIPNNIMGEHDNFDLDGGHVIAAIIRKLWEAKALGVKPVFWGRGTPLREFTYVEDVAKAMLFLLDHYNGEHPVNIGNTGEQSIRSIVAKVCNIFDYDGEVEWDMSKPEGVFRKPSSNEKFLELGWNKEDYTSFDDALKKTCDWFTETYPDIRGV